MLNKNEFYKKTVEHLINQGRRATSNIDTCMYRPAEGLKCAIGVHVSDEDYTPEMETIGIDSLVPWSFCPTNLRKSYQEYPNLMRSLQSLHDDYLFRENMDEFYGHAEALASIYDIDPEFIPDVIKKKRHVDI